MTNGLHTIAWSVTDNNGRVEGIGSRFFLVNNPLSSLVPSLVGGAPARSVLTGALESAAPLSVSVTGRSGFDLTAPYETLARNTDGISTAVIPEVGRLELQLGAVDGGALVVNGTAQDLPIGAHLDLTTGTFAWMPPAGYLGTYRFAFVRGADQIPVNVTIRPITATAAGESEIRMTVDLPQANADVSGPVTIAGWALDPQAWTGSGIGAVHVWASRTGAAGVAPAFVGAADLGAARPDVAAAFGASFGTAGFSLTTTLAPGTYDLAVYAWSTRTGRFEDARTVRVTVR